MNEWEWLRTAAVATGWVTVAGGVLMAVIWLAKGGGRAFGPNDALMARAGKHVELGKRQVTAWSSVQIAMHGFFGICTVGLCTYAVARSTDRVSGYIAVLVVAALTAALGLFMFVQWRSDERPAVDGNPVGDRGPKVEHEIPALIVFLHGAAAAAFVLLVVGLIIVE